jgi:hypothetical protein
MIPGKEIMLNNVMAASLQKRVESLGTRLQVEGRKTLGDAQTK